MMRGTSPVSRVDRQRVPSAINAETARPRGLTSGSARWLTSRATSHVAASGLRPSGERKHRIKPGHVSGTGPLLRPRYPLSRDLVMGVLDPIRRDPEPIQGTRHAYLGVSDRIRGSGLYVQGSDASLWRSS
jgi:hypothetical protein